MNVVNVAQGAFVVLGAYIGWELQRLRSGWTRSSACSSPRRCCSLFGYAVQRVLINLVVNGPIFITLLLTFGLDLVLVQGMNLVFTADYRSIPTSYAGNEPARWASIRVPLGRLLAFGLAIAVTLAPRGHRDPHPYRPVDHGDRHGPRARPG